MEDYWKEKPKGLKQLSYKIQDDDPEWAAKLILAYTDEFAKNFSEYCALNYDLRNGLWSDCGCLFTTDELLIEFKKNTIEMRDTN